MSMECYQSKDVMNTLGISRATLRYYEQKGIVKPKIDDENGYRYYDSADFQVLKQCLVLNNMGYTIAEAASLIENRAFSSLDTYLDFDVKLKKKIAFYEAISRNVNEHLAMLQRDFLELELVEAPRYYTLYHEGTFDFHRNKNSEKMNTLIRGLGVSCISICFNSTFWDKADAEFRVGRSVKVEDADLLFDEPEKITWKTLGGYRCVRTKIHYTKNQTDLSEIKRLNALIRRQGLTITGNPVSLFNLGWRSDALLEIYIPV